MSYLGRKTLFTDNCTILFFILLFLLLFCKGNVLGYTCETN
jgi:hypothetical protein